MSDLKTKPTKTSVKSFLSSIEPEQKKKDCQAICKLMEEVTGEKPVIWGDTIIGFGTYHYKGASGREGDWFRIGFAPRKNSIALYMPGTTTREKDILKKLGKHKPSGSCVHINQLEGLDMKVFKDLVKKSVKLMAELYK